MPLVELEHASMIFRVREQYQITLKEYLLRGMFRRSANPVMEVRAIQDVSLCFGDGDRVGIIGGNGAGKSTLLRLLAGIYYPTRGSRTVNGRISSLFELSLGFEMEASGRQNIVPASGPHPLSRTGKHRLSGAARSYAAGRASRRAGLSYPDFALHE